MQQVTVLLPDGEKKSIPKGTKLQEIAGTEMVAAQVNGRLVDLSQPIEQDVKISFIPVHSKKGLEILRHSAAM